MAESRTEQVRRQMAYKRFGTGEYTKTEKVLNYMHRHSEGITNQEAFTFYNVTRLGSIIYELRHHYGLPIVTHRETYKGQTYARYTLEEVE